MDINLFRIRPKFDKSDVVFNKMTIKFDLDGVWIYIFLGLGLSSIKSDVVFKMLYNIVNVFFCYYYCKRV